MGIFPDDRSLIRLVGMLCLEQNDEWLVGRRYLSAAAMEPLLEKRLHRDQATDHEEGRKLTPAWGERLPTNVGTNSYTTSWDLPCAGFYEVFRGLLPTYRRYPIAKFRVVNQVTQPNTRYSR